MNERWGGTSRVGRIIVKDRAALEVWLKRSDEQKKLVHPEHSDFVEGCDRCIKFRDALLTRN